MLGFRGCPSYPSGLHDGLVPSIHGFCEEDGGGKLHLCQDFYNSLSKNRISEAALANGFRIGDMTRKFDGATVIEGAAAYAVRVKGHVIALELRKVRNIPGSAQRSPRGTTLHVLCKRFVFCWTRAATSGHWFARHVYRRASWEEQANWVTAETLTRGPKHIVRDLIEYMKDKDGSVVNGFCLARKSSIGEANVDTHPSDGSIPQDLLEAVLNPLDPNNLQGRASSSYANDRRESEAMDDDFSNDEESSGDSDLENDAD